MKHGTFCGMWVLLLAFGLGNVAEAQTAATAPPPPPPEPMTLWKFLGIPQAAHRAKDASANKNGNRPQAERKPPLRRLADPINLFSPNPAIKTAAQIKAEEDLAKQKIKAIKYLGMVGCGCYPGVKEALMDALDDCTEDVRFAAAQALASSACNNCQPCSKKCCCDEDLVKKLSSVVYDQDPPGCYKEPSQRVRQAAQMALQACCPNIAPSAAATTPAPVPERPREVPVLPPEVKETPGREVPPPAVREPAPASPILEPEESNELPPGLNGVEKSRRGAEVVTRSCQKSPALSSLPRLSQFTSSLPVLQDSPLVASVVDRNLPAPLARTGPEMYLKIISYTRPSR